MLKVFSLSKTFDSKPALQDVSFTVAPGAILAILGASGSGKSTLLALLAGLETPDSGDIAWGAESVVRVPTHLRGFGLMFQDYALFPHRNARDNVAFGLRMQGWERDRREARAREMLALVGLTGFERRDVSTLSGGEQQRVALARALAPQPRLLMLDEPLGALDRALRARLLADLRGLLRQLRQTALYVTHDQTEAFALADQIAILDHGHLAQIGPPAEVRANPANRAVAELLGA
jgi:ABC-type Fe3+/spermidine/putrescine transport system ATPase subunit